jgi:hypothetical protein
VSTFSYYSRYVAVVLAPAVIFTALTLFYFIPIRNRWSAAARARMHD